MGSIADEARSQRAMIHLTLGQVNLARQLVDNIELKRHQDPRSRAMIGAIAADSDDARDTAGISGFEMFDDFERVSGHGDHKVAEALPQQRFQFAPQTARFTACGMRIQNDERSRHSGISQR